MKKKIRNTVKSTLNKDEIKYELKDYPEGNSLFSFCIKGDHANFDVRILCVEDMEFLMVNIGCPVCSPMDKIEQICRWIADKNYDLILGGFRLDTSDGELTFSINQSLDDGAVNENIVRVAYSTAINTFDTQYEDLMQTLYLNPKDEAWALKIAQDNSNRMQRPDSVLDITPAKQMDS